MSNAFSLDGNESLSSTERIIVDHLFIQSNEEPVTIATNEHLFERAPNTVVANTREELEAIIRGFPAHRRPVMVRRLAGMLVQQLREERPVGNLPALEA